MAEGAISFFLARLVTSRVATVTYGTEYSQTYQPSNPAHSERQSTVYKFANGKAAVPHKYRVFITKVGSTYTVPLLATSYVLYFYHEGRDVDGGKGNSVSLRSI